MDINRVINVPNIRNNLDLHLISICQLCTARHAGRVSTTSKITYTVWLPSNDTQRCAFPTAYGPRRVALGLAGIFSASQAPPVTPLTLSFGLPLPPSNFFLHWTPCFPTDQAAAAAPRSSSDRAPTRRIPILASGSPVSTSQIQFHPYGMSSHYSCANLSRAICVGFRIGTSTKLS